MHALSGSWIWAGAAESASDAAGEVQVVCWLGTRSHAALICGTFALLMYPSWISW